MKVESFKTNNNQTLSITIQLPFVPYTCSITHCIMQTTLLSGYAFTLDSSKTLRLAHEC